MLRNRFDSDLAPILNVKFYQTIVLARKGNKSVEILGLEYFLPLIAFPPH